MIGILLAAATIAVNSVSQNPVTRTVSVNYTLSGESAVVTLDAVTTNGAAMAAADLFNVAGDANRLVGVGSHTLLWQPPVAAGFGPFAANAVEVSLKAWSVDAPPDYMVIDLELPERVRYYTCKEALPGGIEDVRYKTDFLAMRRIPAAGVEWRMGTSVSVRPGSWGNYRDSETTRYVKLTKDFYLAVYETTVRHFYWINNKNFYKFNGGSDPFAPFGGDWDYPIVDLQFVVLRNWFHNANCGYLAGLADPYADDTFHKFWPRDEHEIDAANTPKCNGANCVGGGSYTPTLRVARTRYGIDFDMPTETEWEFACRAGTGATLYNGQELGPNNVLDPALDEIAWYYYNSVDPKYGCSVPHPVGLKKPNGYGLYDMLGNAGEMCLDVHTNYAQSVTATVDPKGAVPTANIRGLRIVVRGGAFHSESTSGTRSGARYNSNGSGCVKDQQSLYWGQPKSASGAEAALSNHASGIRLWAPCKAVK